MEKQSSGINGLELIDESLPKDQNFKNLGQSTDLAASIDMYESRLADVLYDGDIAFTK